MDRDSKNSHTSESQPFSNVKPLSLAASREILANFDRQLCIIGVAGKRRTVAARAYLERPNAN